jgi:phosphoribosylglycinamide formyltransferase 2
MVTMITQSQSEFALHVRAVLGLPLNFRFLDEGASAAFKSDSESVAPSFEIDESCFSKNSEIRIFGKPVAHVGRRMAVVLTTGKDSLKLAKSLIKKIK